ncbi:MAG: type III secretion system chaperone family protein [Planctomycetota bacterium]|jgi:hypothetical protein
MSETAAVSQTAEVLEKVSKVAAEADFILHPHPNADVLMIKFNMGDGRSQTVYIEYTGQTFDGQDCVTFMSPCKVVKKEKLLSGDLNREQVIALLRRNAKLRFGSFALETFEGLNDVLVVMSSQIVDTMDVEEFKTHVAFVAYAADEYERECGQDVF